MSSQKPTPFELAAKHFYHASTLADPDNWREVYRLEPGWPYDFIDMETGKMGQCWTDPLGEWVQAPVGEYRLIEYVGPTP